MGILTLLGPQRQPTVAEALDRLGVAGPVTAITAGWQEREGENEELEAHLKRPVSDLRLHRRGEQLFSEDRKLFEAYRARQDRLREMQALYRYRLDFAIEPARELLVRDDPRQLLDAEREAAIQTVRRLDDEHLQRIAAVHRDFERRWRPLRRAALRRHRDEIADLLQGSAAVVVAGGHVAVLLNRLRLFRMAELLVRRPLFAWSAGAMALGERIVLFHDSPPWGAGNAEILEVGLGLYRRLLPLPHARRRLRLDDSARVALFARRFAPLLPLALDDGVAVVRDQDRWRPLTEARWLAEDGSLRPLETP